MRYLLLLLLCARWAGAQVPPLETPTRKAWQPRQPVLATDFQAPPTAKLRELEQKAGLRTDTRVSLGSVLDVPAKRRDRGPKLEQAYFAAIWLKDQSATLTTDTAALAQERILFDLAELAARQARRTLQQLQDSSHAYGTAYIYYVPVANQACAWYHQQVDAYTRARYIDKQPEAHATWRRRIDVALRESAAWATPAQAAQRLLGGQPVEPGYIKSPTVLGQLGCGQP
ncbi:hypothetical protein LJ737_12605 [Hymenobacter sp. 15J16-1T3B]|uniref:hypothetical protein n=1 Tax=Hymenobacter sp. 15J16-1T3B TaxID=2886941 RepID=UPI001D105852|nr:hypothetical protein [Hymenobacter sp. 15J16-1T3B]MCC3158082.1 hypothetical protein [Hymenobacter sp. 15J16-1T3B]